MTETQATRWFSAKVRLVCLMEPAGALRYMDSVYVFRSVDFQAAFTRALELGKCQEKSYRNAEKKKVVWQLVAIVSLDMIMAESLRWCRSLFRTNRSCPWRVLSFRRGVSSGAIGANANHIGSPGVSSLMPSMA